MGTGGQVYCTDCGAENPALASYCARCGAHLLDAASVASTPTSGEEEAMACPHCRRADRVEKVSAIVGAGTVTGTSTGGGTSVGYTAGAHPRPVLVDTTTTTTTTTRSALAQRLAPPAPPSLPEPAWTYLGGCGLLALGFVCLSAAIPTLVYLLGGSPHFVGTLLVLVGLWVGLAFLYRRKWVERSGEERAFMARNTPLFEQAQTTWQGLYYCQRCDGVFAPGGSFVPVPSRAELLGLLGWREG